MKKGIGAIVSVINGLTSIQTIKKGLTTVYESFKELLINGIPPLTLLNVYHNESNEKYNKLIDYKIYGDSVQESKNTFDATTMSERIYAYIPSETVWRRSSDSYSIRVPVKPNTTYKVSTENNVSIFRVACVESENYPSFDIAVGEVPIVNTVRQTNNTPVEITTTANTLYLAIQANIDTMEETLKTLQVIQQAPTPDAPIEIVSVGDKTKNLFDINEFLDVNENITVDGSKITLSNVSHVSIRSNIIKKLKPNTGYSISVKNRKIESGESTNLTFRIALLPLQGEPFYLSYGNDISNRVLPNDLSKYEFLTIYATQNGVISLEDIQIEENTKITDYEPYGYRIPVKISGKNIINPAKWLLCNNNGGFEITTTNTISTYGKNYIETTISAWKGIASDIFEIKKINSFGFKINKNAIVDNYETYHVIIQYYDENKSKLFSRTINKHVIADTEYIIDKDNFSQSPEVKYFRVGIVVRGKQIENLKIYDMYINKDNSKTFEPYIEPITTNIYLNEPLRKIEDKADYIDFETGKVVRQIDETIFTGNENWVLNSYSLELGYKVYRTSLVNKVIGSIGLCNIASYKTWNNSLSDNYFSISASLFLIRTNNEDDVEAWIEFVRSMYENNTPVKCYCVLTEVKEETIDLPNIPTHKGRTVIEIDTSIIPSNMEVKYYGK